MEKHNGVCVSILVTLLAWQCIAVPKSRDPFSCSHAHGAMPAQTSMSAPIIKTQAASMISQASVSSVTDDASSEWHVIAEKDDTVIMQHRDGSIREIIVGKK